MSGNLVIMHGGGPTAVINSSLYGAIRQAQNASEIDKVYVAVSGTGGLMKEQLFDVSDYPDEKLRGLLSSPSSAIGSSRDALENDEYEAMRKVLLKWNIRYVLMNGGNGTMDTCGKLQAYVKNDGINVIGIPKTMDNDLNITDHAPGFASAARYMAGTIGELCCDIAGLPHTIVIVEALGRNAGWVTAASALAKDSYGQGPDLIYLPERPFSEEKFLQDVKALYDRKGCGVIVVSEGLVGEDGKPVVPPVLQIGRAVYYGDVSAHLANLITKELQYKTRSQKPGLGIRASIAWQSSVDRDEAEMCGRAAVDAVVAGETAKMVAIRRLSDAPYRSETFLTDIRDVMMTERKMPEEYINDEGNGVTEAFLNYVRPLLGNPLPKLIDLREDYLKSIETR